MTTPLPEGLVVEGIESVEQLAESFGTMNTDFTALKESGVKPPDPDASWIDGIDAGMRNEESLKQVPDINALAKNYMEMKKYQGGSIKLPDAEAGKEEWNKIYDKMGRPKDAEGYAFDKSNIDESIPWNEDAEKMFKATFHDIGLTKAQGEMVLNKYVEMNNGIASQNRQTIQAAETAYKEEVGINYDRNIALAQRVVALGGEDVKKILDESGVGNSVPVIRMFAELGKKLAEADVIPTHTEGIMGTKEAQTKIADIMGDAEHAYNKKGVSEDAHEAAVKEVNDLFRIVHG